jgi:hypothetical protein
LTFFFGVFWLLVLFVEGITELLGSFLLFWFLISFVEEITDLLKCFLLFLFLTSSSTGPGCSSGLRFEVG